VPPVALTAEFPHIERLVGDGPPTEFVRRLIELSGDRGRFDRGLGRLLDGIELDLGRPPVG
jgi:hypothetical protein